MNFYNLKNKAEKLNFKEASIKGQGSNKGLFFPEKIPMFSEEFINNLNNFSDNYLANFADLLQLSIC